EGGRQLNLLVCEWTHRGSPQGDHSNRQAFSQERNPKKRAKSASLLEWIPVFRISQNVDDMNDFTFKQNTPGDRPTVNYSCVTRNELGVFKRQTIGRFFVKNSAPRSTYGARVRLAKSCRRFYQRIQYRLQIES